jgi:hypothetical protein
MSLNFNRKKKHKINLHFVTSSWWAGLYRKEALNLKR